MGIGMGRGARAVGALLVLAGVATACGSEDRSAPVGGGRAMSRFAHDTAVSPLADGRLLAQSRQLAVVVAPG